MHNINYRICYRRTSVVPSLGIHEVYYDDFGNIIFYNRSPVVPFGDDVPELMEQVKDMMVSFEKEIIDLDALDIKMERRTRQENKNGR